MAVQNLVSAVLAPDVKSSVLQKLADVKAALSFLITIPPGEKREFVKVGKVYLPFVDEAHDAVSTHPEIMPQVFSVDEFNKDYQLSKDLVPIYNLVSELAESVQATMFAVNSDAMSEALEVYSAVHSNKDKVPGLEATYGKMAEFFRKTRRPKSW